MLQNMILATALAIAAGLVAEKTWAQAPAAPDKVTSGSGGFKPADAQATARDLSLQALGGGLAPSSQTVIYTAREFITMDPAKLRAEAIAVRDGKIVAVGSRAEVGAAAGKDARLDKRFDDKVAIAGFVEQHVHPVLATLAMNTFLNRPRQKRYMPPVKLSRSKLRASICGSTWRKAAPASPP